MGSGDVQYGVKPCVVCGCPFVPVSSNSKACGPDCKAVLLKASTARAYEKVNKMRVLARVAPPDLPRCLSDRPADMDDPVKYEHDEWNLGQVRKHYNMDRHEPAKHRARSLGEAEALQRRE